MRHRSASTFRVAIALLYGGVAPVDLPRDPCAKAPLQAAPATEREWLVVTFDAEDLRVRRRGEDAWLEIHDAKWQVDSLIAVSRPRWTSDGRHLPADSLSIPWDEIERIDKPAGTRAGIGAGIGGAIGLGVGLVVAAILEEDCSGYLCGIGYVLSPLVAVPTGALIGALIGSTERGWAPFACLPPRPAGDLSGVPPLAAAPRDVASDVCSGVPLSGTPPSPVEWSLLEHESDHFRARLRNDDDWIYFGDAEWTAAGLRARGGEGWDTGHLVFTDSLDVRWVDIARLDADRGTYSARGTLLGAAAGCAAFAALAACDDCDVGGWSVFAIPVGMLIGGVIGASQPMWRAVFCAEAPGGSAGAERAP